MKALLVIDMLNDFVREDGALPVPGSMKLVSGINANIDRFHEKGWPVIFICDSHDEDDMEFKIWPKHSVRGTTGAEVVPELHKDKEDLIVRKKRYSAFFGTGLERILKEKNIDSLILTGVLTDICIMHTAADASMRGYKVRVLKDCVMSVTDEVHEWALKHMKEILNSEIV